MDLIVLNWFKNFLLQTSKQLLERLFRILLFCLPIGIYLTLLQFRNKPSSVSSLSAFTTEHSVWQHVFPGFALVAIDPVMFKTTLKKRNEMFQAWIQRNRYTLSFLFALVLVLYILSKEIWG